MQWSGRHGVLLMLLLASCSKPAAVQEKASPTPTPAASPAKSTAASKVVPAATPALTKEDVDGYAASLGVDNSTAQTLLETEMVLAPKLKEALEAGDVATLSNLTQSHVEKLQQQWAAGNKYPPDPDGKIPAWFCDQLTRKGPDAVGIKMNQAGYLGLANSQLIDQRIAYAVTTQIAQARPNLVADVLTSRMESAPSPVDGILYEALIGGLADRSADDGRTGTNDPDEDLPGSGAIRQMATAQNPIYRLIAVEQSGRLSTENRLTLYEGFIDEKDPQIKQRAIESLAQTRSDGTIEILRRFEQSSLQQGQKENADLAAQRIKQLENKGP